MEPSAAEPRSDDPIEAFVERWAASSAAERANFQPFATGLPHVLGVTPPEPATGDPTRDRYRFEYPVRFANPDGSSSTGFIDLYKRDAFVMEAKQGSDQQLEEQLALFGGFDSQARKGTAVRGTRNWTAAMLRARGQAERYAKAPRPFRGYCWAQASGLEAMPWAIWRSRSPFRASHSHTTRTFHPSASSCCRAFASRATFRASFGCQ